jgi:lipase maturation factor
MPELIAADAGLALLLIERGLALVYLVAFVVAVRQFPVLCGERGLDPATRVLSVTTFRRLPTIFQFGYSDRRLRVVAWTGIVVSALLFVGVLQQLPLPVTMAAWFVLWALYLSIVQVGGTFYGFGWETLLCEAGFLAIFLGNAATPPTWPVILAYRWLAFRVELGAGLIKLRGDPCWRDLTCMDYHHETQPMPNPLSWFFHRMPEPLHRIEVLGNFAAQLVLPWGLFLPQPIATISAVGMIGTQLYLVVSGNYAWLNWLTIVVACAGLGDGVIGAFAPGLVPATSSGPLPVWFAIAVLALAVVVVGLSAFPVRNLLSRRQAMNTSFDRLRLVNSYGAFGTVSRERYEVVVEGTVDDRPGPDSEWREYGFRGKPGDPRRLPPQLAPYHLRLDWLMWFLPLSPRYGEGWFVRFLGRLLEGDRAVLALLRHNPFPDRPPSFVRARLFRYRFTTRQERRETGQWWDRIPVGDYVRPVALSARARDAWAESHPDWAS